MNENHHPLNAETAAVRLLIESIFPQNSQSDIQRFLPLAMVLLKSEHPRPWRQRTSSLSLSSSSEKEKEIWRSRLDRNFKKSSKKSQSQLDHVHHLYHQLQMSLVDKNVTDGLMNVLTRFMDFDPCCYSSSSSPPPPPPPPTAWMTTAHSQARSRHFILEETKKHLSDKLKLNTNKTSTHTPNILYDEVNILRECILALEHVDGENIQFLYPQVSEEDSCSQPQLLITTQNVMMYYYSGIRIRSNILPMHSLQTSSRKNDCWLLGSGSIDALRICGEAGWLYQKITSFIDTTVNTHCSGVAKALAVALQVEVTSFQKLVASLDQRLLVLHHHPAETNLTSRRLMVELRRPIHTLRSLALLADGISTGLIMGGGQILTAIYFHSLHGHVLHKELMTNILTVASKPWFDAFFLWIFHGILPTRDKKTSSSSSSSSSQDLSCLDFFVNEDVTVEDVNMWQGRYQLIKDEIPTIPCMISRVNLGTGSGHHETSLLGDQCVGAMTVDVELANECLIVGKGVNFIRKCLADSKWVMNLDDMIPKTVREQASTMDREHLKACLGIHYNPEDRSISSSRSGSKISLRDTISMASTQVHKHILDSLVHQHHLLEHLKGLKDFLLLGQGDFISAIIDTLYAHLETQGTTKSGLYFHHVMGIVQDALRATNAAFLPKFVLDNVRVKLMTDSNDRIPFWLSDKKYPSSFDSDPDQREDPLELFSLDYSIHSPLAAVVYPTVLRKYRRIFSLLFRLKRIEWMLNRSWKQSRALFHALQAEATKYAHILDGDEMSRQELDALTRTKIMMRKVSMTRQSMLHFLSNLQSYLMFEVLEVGWKELVRDLRYAKTLDEVIKTHNLYLNVILKKSLLGDDSSLGGTYPNKMERQLRIVLTIAYRFCQLHDSIFGEANQAIEAAASKRRRGEGRVSAGEWGYEDPESDDYNMNMFTLSDEDKLEKVSSVSSDFDSAIRDLLQLLNDKINDGPPNDDSSILFSPSTDTFTVGSTSSLSDTGSRRSKKGLGPGIESDCLQFLAYRLDFSDFYERSSA